MKSIFTGRLIFVIVVTVLSLIFVWPTASYFAFVSGLPAQPTVEQEKARQQRLDKGGTIKLGLDLQGGVDFLIEVDTDKLLQQKLVETADGIKSEFKQDDIGATVEADAMAGTITVALEDAKDVNFAKDILEHYRNVLDLGNLDSLGTAPVVFARTADDAERNQADSIEAALRTIKKRVDEFGLTQPVVVKQPPDRIRVQIPGETNPDRIRKSLLKTADLEFRLLEPQHDSSIQAFAKPDGTVKDEFLEEVATDEDVVGGKKVQLKADIPGLPAGYRLFLGDDKKFGPGGEIISERKNLAFLLKDKAELTGKNLRRAAAYTDVNSLDSPEKVSLEFDSEGADKFADVTSNNTDRRFAILIDGKVVTSPVINEPILGGRCEISGSFTREEAADLALTLKSGSLPAPLKIVNQQSVGASLGKDSVVDSGKALIVGAIGLVLVMLVVYSTAGMIANIAMFLNVLMILAILSLADATLTLSGIGGILLTMGMALDANVLIYERLREELGNGKPLRAAMNAAFDRAFAVILDSNITSLLPALVLVLFEIVEGSVKGFWVALGIGLVVNLYTGMTVTRALMEAWIAKRKTISIGSFNPFKSTNINFMGVRKATYAFSGILTAISLGYLLVHGTNPGIDFTGGVTAVVSAAPDVERAAMEKSLAADFKDVRVVKVLNKDQFQVTIQKEKDATANLDEIEAKMASNLSGAFPGKTKIEQKSLVEPLIGSEFKWTAFLTVLVTSLIILGYLGLRFRPVFGVGAVVALLHDLIITLGLFVLFGRSLTMDIVTALLLILGYSVNDTIVVFDRVRETMGEHWGKPISEVINEAVNKTLSRTMFTGGTTLITLLSMLFLGGVGLSDFSLVLLIGVGFGTYSSVFVASAVACSILTAKEKKEGAAKAHGQTKTVKITA